MSAGKSHFNIMNEKIKELELKIIKHKSLYYQGKPEISDFEYDEIEEQLKKLDPDSYVLSMVGTTVFSEDKIEHNKKMLSLNKTYKADELIKWQEGRVILSTFKIDGSSCSIIYKNGIFDLAKTRGDGRFGENISRKVLCIEHIPTKIETTSAEVEVRGEVYCTEENFIKLSEEMEMLGLEKPTSQRNIVAGLLGRKENITLSRFLSFQAFELIEETRSYETEKEKFNRLQKMGFDTPEIYLNESKEDIDRNIDEAKVFMADGNYLIDGIVFSYNDLKLHDTLGETAHHPRYKMAFKFQGETKVTKIESISWQVSRNGYLTPVANVVPVELSGAKVSRVTLHNYGMVKQFELKKDDEIEIVRSGEVIPKFLEVKKSSSNEFKVPEFCPSCNQKVEKQDIRLVCVNDFCPDKLKDGILNFIQKIGIDDLSSKRLEELIKAGLIKDISSLYEIKVDDLLKLEKVKDKLANKIVNNIEKSKHTDLITFLASLGINGGAYNKCEKVVKSGVDTIEKMMTLTIPMLMNIDSFAEKSATEFITSFHSKKDLVQKLLTFDFVFKDINKSEDSKITGKKFCITGTLSMKRSELQKIVKDNGGIVQSAVTSATDYLLTNDTESSSSKFKKAQTLDIAIISETVFFELIG